MSCFFGILPSGYWHIAEHPHRECYTLELYLIPQLSLHPVLQLYLQELDGSSLQRNGQYSSSPSNSVDDWCCGWRPSPASTRLTLQQCK